MYLVEFEKIQEWKMPLLEKAYQKFSAKIDSIPVYNSFLEEHGWWLNDFALFMACKKCFDQKPWTQWDAAIKSRRPEAMEYYKNTLSNEIGFQKFLQFVFFSQWNQLKQLADKKGIVLFGDLPLYVSADSSDVWANPDIFLLDENLEPTFVGGVPPDYFSETGQLWGNPVYNWARIAERGFDWWMARLYFNLRMFGLIRVDHFRGLESFWSVPAKEETAVLGEWVPAKGYEMLRQFRDQVGSLPLVAEDLGVITPEVERLRDDFGLPGMKIFQFGFTSDATNEYLPFNYGKNFIAYTGTHDNDTMVGWFRKASPLEKKNLRKYYHGKVDGVAKWAVESVWSSVADVAVAPVQDILGLDTNARMNIPGTASGNWGWRLKPGKFTPKQIRYLKVLNEKYGRVQLQKAK
jgi:4-alpha-glucanotransferase